MNLDLEISNKKHYVQMCKDMLEFVKAHTYTQLVQKLIKIKPLDRYSHDNIIRNTGIVPGNDPSDVCGYPKSTESNKLYLFNGSSVYFSDSVLGKSGFLLKRDVIQILKDDIKYWKQFLVRIPKNNNINFNMISGILEDTSADLNGEDYGLAADDISVINTNECPLPNCLLSYALKQVENDVCNGDSDKFFDDLTVLQKHFPECNLNWV